MRLQDGRKSKGFVRRRAGAAVIVGALALSITACGSGGDTEGAASPGETASPDPTPSTSPTGASSEYDTTFQNAKPSIDQNARAVFGSEAAAAGTAAAVQFTQDYVWNGEYLRLSRPEGNPTMLALGDHMTPDARRDWSGAVRTYGKTSGQEASDASVLVYSLVFYDPFEDATLKKKKLEANPEGPVLINPKIVSVKATVSNDNRLQVLVNSSADVRLLLGGKPQVGPATRETTYYMAYGPDGWKISAWRGSHTFGEGFRPEK